MVPHELRTLRDFIKDNRSGEPSQSGLQRRQKARAESEAKRKRKAEKKLHSQGEQKEGENTAEQQQTETERAAADGLASLEERKEPQPPPPQQLQPPPADEESNSTAEPASDGADDSGAAAEDSDPEEVANAEEHLAVAPQVHVVNGIIVINEESLTLPAPSSIPSPFPLLAESPAGRFTSSTFLRHTATAPWTASETSLFYRALSAFGTDFTLISLMMKGRDRGQVKRKYKKEERENGRLLEEALKRRVKMDVEEFGRRKKEKVQCTHARTTHVPNLTGNSCTSAVLVCSRRTSTRRS